MSSIIMGIGRAIGETMAVVMVIGNQPLMPASLTQGQSLTANVVLEMSYHGGPAQECSDCDRGRPVHLYPGHQHRL